MAQAHQLDIEYSKDFTDLIELVYGQELLSQGGSDSIDLMFAGQDLEGKKLLDVGSGLGGVDFYLASKYVVDITGIDCVSRMVEDANKRKEKQALRGMVTFVHQDPDNTIYPFADDTFDIIFSKEAFLHIADKASILKEINRVLKPGGQLIILDWLVDSHEFGSNITEMMDVDGLDLKMATLEEYEDALQAAGFGLISAQCMNDRYVSYTNDNIATIQSKEAELLKLIGQGQYAYCLKTWALQKRIFELGEVRVTLLKASKPVR